MEKGMKVGMVSAVMMVLTAMAPLAAAEEESGFVPTYGYGLETGFFFTDLARFNRAILESNDTAAFETAGLQHTEVGVESVLVENFRLGVHVGTLVPWHRSPSLVAWYVGMEPAYVAGDETWEMAVGATVSVGALTLYTEEGARVSTSLTLLRPFLEVRRHMLEGRAVYLRGGFSQLYPGSPRSEELVLENVLGRALTTVDLSTGGIYLALGFRYGRLQAPGKGLEESTGEDDGEE